MHHTLSLVMILFAGIILLLGCEKEGEDASKPSPHAIPERKEQKTDVTITVGGKTWKIDPNRSYQAEGIWINPNPRPLTATERARLAKVRAQIETLSAELDQLSLEENHLIRIEKPTLKMQYSFGMPPPICQMKKSLT